MGSATSLEEAGNRVREVLLADVGKPFGDGGEIVAPDPVNVPMIRHWVDALDDQNPIYLDAAAALFPTGKIFPEGIASRSIGRMQLRVVAAKGTASKRSYKLKDCYLRGWVLNPDGCGFRAGLQRALSEQGLSLQINLETFGTELQLGLVANGQGLGLVPEPLLAASRHRDQLEVLNVSDFKPQVDLWLFHPRYLGNLQEPVELFGSVSAQRLDGNKIS